MMVLRAARFAVVLSMVVVCSAACLPAQQAVQPIQPATAQPRQAGTMPQGAAGNASSSASAPSISAPSTISPRLRIGPGDEADVTVYGLPELSQHVRVSSGGEISYPLIGTLKIAGLTSEETQALIEKKLTDGGFLKNPHVTFYVKDYTSDGVTVLG